MSKLKTVYIPTELVFKIMENPDSEFKYRDNVFKLGCIHAMHFSPFDYTDICGIPLHQGGVSIYDESGNVWVSTVSYRVVPNSEPVKHGVFEYFYLWGNTSNE